MTEDKVETALGLVEAILEQADLPNAEQELVLLAMKGGEEATCTALAARLGVVQGHAERLKALLEKGTGPALLDALKVARFALLNRDKATGTPDERAVWQATAEVAKKRVEKAIEAAS